MRASMGSKPTREQTEQAAAAWLLKRNDPQWSAVDEDAFEQWLAQAPGNRVSFVRLESIWSDADRLKSIASGLPKGVPPRGAIEQSPFFTLKQSVPPFDHVKEKSAESPRRVRFLAIAASVITLVAAGVLLNKSGFFAGDTYRTAIGGLSTIPAADGSLVTLNTNSKVKIHFTELERRIELTQGEAFFEVAKDPKRPFIVYAGDRRVVAIGTKFSVRRSADDIRVVVTDGKIRLDAPSSAQAKEELFLAAGAVAEVNHNNVTVKRKSVPEVEQALSWRSGYIMLDGTPLSEAVAEFNRYNIRQLAIGDPSLAVLKMEGNFRANNLDGFVRLLEEGFEIQAGEAPSDRIVLVRKEK